MSRITIKNVEFYLDCLNSKTKKQYTLLKQGVPTSYTLVIENEHGGAETVSRSGLSTTEIYEVVYTLNNFVITEEK